MTLPGFPRTLITLPLLGLALTLMQAGHAAAAGKAAEEAVQMLSKARVADQRCDYLSGSERAELSRFTARAELAAASQSSPAAARAAVGAGTTQGKAAVCSPELRADVRETYEAARAAMAQASAAERQQPATAPAPSKPKTVRQAKAPRGDMESKPRSSASLNRYERIVRAYYLERECRSLSKAAAGRFWQGVARLHRATVAANGASRVAPLMNGAERRARGSSCGARAMAEIRQGYDEVLSR